MIPCYTRAISERFRDKELIIKRYMNSPSLLYFTLVLIGLFSLGVTAEALRANIG